MKSTPVVLFDLYGTLVLTHEHGDAWEAWKDLLIDYVRSNGDEEKAEAALISLRVFWHEEISGRDSEMTIFERRLERFLAALDIHAAQRQLGALADNLCKTWQFRLEIDPHCGTMFDRLTGSFRVGLVSNFDHPPHVHSVLEENSLDSRFETVVISAEEGIKKPDPEILLIACSRLGCDPARTIYVGDSIVDYQAASAAAITPVIIRRDGQKEIENNRETRFGETDRILFEKARSGELEMITSLSEVPAVAARLLLS